MNDFSRKPSDYRPDPSGHFRRRFRDRDVPPCVLSMAIEGGKPIEQDDGRIRLETQYLGYDFVVIIDPDKQIIVTTYCDDDGW